MNTTARRGRPNQSLKGHQRMLNMLAEPALLVGVDGLIYGINTAAVKFFDGKISGGGQLLSCLHAKEIAEAEKYLRQCAQSSQPLARKFEFSDDFLPKILYGSLLIPPTEGQSAVVFLRIDEKSIAHLKFRTLKEKIFQLNQEVRHRLRTQKSLEKQSRFLEAVLNSMGEGVLVTDLDDVISFVNPTAEVLTGWSLEDSKGAQLSKILNVSSLRALDGTPLNRPLSDALLTEKTFTGLLCQKSGEQLNIEVTSAPISADDNKSSLVIVFHDITETHKLHNELSERAHQLASMNERKNQFMTMLAHELRAPLAPISYAAELIEQNPKSQSVTHSSIATINRKVKHLKRLVDDLLDVSRISLGKMNLALTPVDVAALTESVYEDFYPLFKQEMVELSFSKPGGAIWIDADSDRIIQVLHNLLFNALKFTPAHGEVCISLVPGNEEVILRIVDTGIGIDSQAIDELFEPFTQAEQPLDRSSGGLGLGLSLVRGIVELHGGQVTASSAGRNQGTNLEITLPLTETLDARVEHTQHTPPKQQKHHILLIEDDMDTASLLGELLILHGHDVVMAHTGRKGVSLAREMAPTFIFCDIGLPEMDGFEVVEALRNHETTASVPIVALSGYSEQSFIDRALSLGCDAHIAKPATFNELQQALDTLG